MITREEYIYYPALSASRIKSHYKGDSYVSQYALDKGKSFHERLLEVNPMYMDAEAKGAYKSITDNGVWYSIWKKSRKEIPFITNLSVEGEVVPAKAMFDIYSQEYKLMADVKITQAKNIHDFERDMIEHYNHIQAVWFSKVVGLDPRSFIFIGMPKSTRLGISRPQDVMFLSLGDHHIEQADSLINQYIKTKWKQDKQFIEQRWQMNQQPSQSIL